MFTIREALAFSLALHAVILWIGQDAAVPASIGDQTSRRPLTVLVNASAGVDGPARALPTGHNGPIRNGLGRSELRRSQTAANSGLARVPEDMPDRQLVVASSDAAASRSTEPQADLQAPRITASSTAMVGGASSVAGEATASQAEPGEPGRTPEGDDIRSYRLRLAALAAGFKDYPSLARERGWEGVVGVRVRLVPEQPFPQVSVARSSGVPVLDEAARGMIARASRHLAVPLQLQRRTFDVDLPVDYRLD